MPATPTQLAAIAAEGNVLVAAGAGAGKTTTLVSRCVQRLLDPQIRARLDEILMVTFTEAAAAEMRARVRQRLEEEIAQAASADSSMREHAEEQLLLLDTANICTLHSFCARLVRQHFHQLGIDPQVVVLDEPHAALLMEETLDEVLHRYYTDKEKDAETTAAVQRLIQNCGGGLEEPVRGLIRHLHEYSQTLVNPTDWLQSQCDLFNQVEPLQWRQWHAEALESWRQYWLAKLAAEAPPSGDDTWNRLIAGLGSVQAGSSVASYSAVLASLPSKKEFRRRIPKPPDDFFAELEFLKSLARTDDGEPLLQDWQWVRPDMAALLRVTDEFTHAFARSKREQAAIDFHDLEQFTLRLLLDGNGMATPLARRLQLQFRYLFIDECQDINAAQDAILRAISNNEQPNRFLVGDVKQSIYRFRLADPRIFQQYERDWGAGRGGQVIPLQENFRSREALIQFFNAVFSDLMHEGAGGVRFEPSSKLIFGAPDTRQPLAADGPRVQFHLLITGTTGASNGDAGSDDANGSAPPDSDPVAELNAAEQEARIVASELARLRAERHQVWDNGSERDVEWRDMAVLLRAPGGRAQTYAREFTRQQIPLSVAQTDFFESLEILDLLNTLAILDNPLQDVPLLAVLHSPVGGLSVSELATVRLSARREYFWTALKLFHEAGSRCKTWEKASTFLDRFQRWRRMGRDASLSTRLHTIITETSYMDWLIAQADNPERAAQSVANVQRLLAMAEQFDPYQRQGLPRFLRYVEAQQQVPAREPVAGSGNTVQLLSIHRSKGLEYPVVVVPDLARNFNTRDLTANVLIDPQFGLCPKIKPPHVRQRYPSLPHWLSSRKEHSELLGEELRLLYVAMTRARDTLLLVGGARRSTAEKWSGTGSSIDDILAGTSMLSWLGPWLARNAGTADWLDVKGQTNLFSWRIHDPSEAPGHAAASQLPITRSSIEERVTEYPDGSTRAELPDAAPPVSPALPFDASILASAPYPHVAATHEAAKASVSSLRRKLKDSDSDARTWFTPARLALSRESVHDAQREMTAAEIGVAHHTFLEFADTQLLAGVEGIESEIQRLIGSGNLTEIEAAHLDREALAHFWSGELGEKIRGARDVRRELPFTARFDCSELATLGLVAGDVPAGEFIVIQGVVDLAVLMDDEIWLLDFKTDDVTGKDVKERAEQYRPQLAAYAAALERIYPGRRVTRRCLHFLAARQTIDV